MLGFKSLDDVFFNSLITTSFAKKKESDGSAAGGLCLIIIGLVLFLYALVLEIIVLSVLVYLIGLVFTNKIKEVQPLKVSNDFPKIGDKALIASGPFGYGIPGMMVPIFEGIYSGKTPDKKDYYTLQVVPGSSGSLIVNSEGDVIGIVSMFITGSFCPGRLGCQVLPSGVMVSVPLSIIQDLVYPDEK